MSCLSVKYHDLKNNTEDCYTKVLLSREREGGKKKEAPCAIPSCTSVLHWRREKKTHRKKMKDNSEDIYHLHPFENGSLSTAYYKLLGMNYEQ